MSDQFNELTKNLAQGVTCRKSPLKPNTPSAFLSTPNRRAFLRGLGALGVGSLFCSRPAIAGSARYAQRFQLLAEGTVTDFSLVWPAPQIPPLPPGTLVGVRVEFPIHGNDILEFHTFVATKNAPHQPLLIVTLFHMRVDKIVLSETPGPNFRLFRQMLDNPVGNNPN